MTKDQAIRIALEALEKDPAPLNAINNAKCFLYSALEQPDQEPVAWMYVNRDGECEQIEFGTAFDDPSVTLLYAAPPKREWKGLTDEEIDYIWGVTKPDYEDLFDFPRAIEAKLREKNHAI